MTDDREVPQDRDAEMSVLGAMMLSRVAVFDVLGSLAVEDFYQPKHAVVFAAIGAVVSAGVPVDAISVGDWLTKAGKVGAAGGLDYLHMLTGFVPSPGSASNYAAIVRDKAILRRLVEAGMRIQQMGYASEGEPAALAETARAELDLAVRSGRSELLPIGSVLNSLVDVLEEKIPRYVPTPWPELDKLIGGLRAGCLYVIGARPGQGKTMAGLQLAMELMHKGPVAFSSLEMSTEQLLTRLIAARGRVHMNNLMSNTLSAEQWVKVQSMRLDILKMPLYVDERSGVNVTQIKAFARSVSRKGPIAGVVVDYLQLVTGGDGRQNRTEVVGEISRQLKILARELDCPVVALSQLNRESVKGGHRRPTLGDLRESGSIEQDADVVMLLQREVDKNDNELDTLAVWVAKNRHGQQGMKKLLWEGQYARLSPLQYGFGGFAGLGD